MSEDLIERLREGRTTGTDLRWTVTPEHLEAAAEIERLRAKLASAKEVIEPFAAVLTAPDLDPNALLGEVITVGHLRAAAEWMEKGDE